ncbi:YoaK family protein [Mesorhizobium sp. WSM4935]|uniref:YoaK family protein n=1 Tax=Mesorhizobium sp. WSM4935 TaxID=3038547 RepID=UPI002415250F|nr:YoaK family protein [Mesorhizobium sp. WSM4935]MDG4876276.1 YoaK family protein [Mesorhizobium sp. WSM4935]
MLVSEGDRRTLGIDIRLASLLAAIAGSLNAAGFQATGFFTANMTGNVSSLSDHLGLAQFGTAAFFGALVGAFVTGAFISGLLIEAGRKQGVRAIYAYSITFEAALLVVLGLADIALTGPQSGWALVLGLSFIMGLQNAATTLISNARVRTTHVSGMATDIGLGLAALLSSSSKIPNAMERLRLHTGTIFCFLFGGVVGAVLYNLIGGYLLFCCAAVLLAVSLPEGRRAKALP